MSIVSFNTIDYVVDVETLKMIQVQDFIKETLLKRRERH